MNSLRFHIENRIKSVNIEDIYKVKYDVYEMTSKPLKETQKIIHDIGLEIYRLQFEGFEPNCILLGRKAYEAIVMQQYETTNGQINLDTLHGYKIILDGSDDSYSYKVLCDNKTELLTRYRK